MLCPDNIVGVGIDSHAQQQMSDYHFAATISVGLTEEHLIVS